MAAEDISLRVGVENVDQIASAIGTALADAFQKPTEALLDIQKTLNNIAKISGADIAKGAAEAGSAYQQLADDIQANEKAVGGLGESIASLAERLAAAIGSIEGTFKALDSLFENIDQKIAAVLDRIRELIDSGQRFGSGLGAALGAAGNTTSAFAFDLKNLNEQIDSSKGSTEAFVAAYKNFFPAEIIKQLAAENKNLTAIQQQLNSEVENLNKTDLQALRLQFDTTERKIKELTQVGITSAVAQRQAEENASRERVAIARAESSERNRLIGQQVAQAQIAAKAESDAVRTSSQESIALAQSAAKQRVATFKLVAQAFQSTERLITRTFEITTNVLSTAFRGLISIAETTTSSIASLFKRSGDKINNDFSQTMSSNETTLQNSVNQQQTIINNFVQSANRTLGNIGLGAAGGLLAGGALIGRALTGGFRRQALLEESERSLTILLGDAEKAVQLKERTLEVVRGTPFSLDQFADAAAQLVAFNVDAEKVPRFLEAIADSAAVKGGNAAQSIDTLVRVFGQVTTTARISLTDINSIAGAGVPALDILGNAFGATADEMRDLISSGAIPAQDALDALTEGIINGTDGVNGATAAFGGLAKELGNTTRGAIANFGAALDRAGANVIEKFRPAIIAFVGLATQLVDAFGKVAANIAETIANSPIFRAIVSFAQTASKAISNALKAADGAIKAFSDGLLLAASAFASLFVARRIPALLSAIQFAIARLLTPVNIAFVALTALGAFFSRLLEQSPGLRAALSSIGDAFRSAFEPIGNLVSRIIPALQESLGSLLTGALGAVSAFVLRFLLPAVQRLANFLTGTVIPAVRNVAANVAEFLQGAFATFVNFATTRLVPILVTAFGVVFGAIKRVVDFVQDTILPVVLPVLRRFADFAVSAFTSVADFVTGTLVPGIQRGFKIIVTEVTNFVGAVPGALREFVTNIRQAFSERSFRGVFDAFKTLLGNFTPIAAAAGLTVALAFINPFAALIAGLGVVAFAAFGSDIISAVRPQLQRVLDFITGLFSGPNLRKIAVEFLKLVNRIGQILGQIVSDPRVVGLVGALAAFAATVAVSFVAGFVQGIASNVPALTEGLIRIVGAAFREALKAIVRNPAFLLALVGLIASAAALRALSQAGQRAGQAITQGLRTGTVGAGTVGGGASFWQGFVGSPADIQAAIQPGLDRGRQILTREVQFNNRLIQRLTGTLPQLTGTAAQQLRQQQAQLRGLAATYGEAAVAGARFATGLQAVRQGLIFREFTTFSQGIRAIGQSLRQQLPAIGQAAGTILGGALAASFSARLLLQGESLGERVAGGLGLAATGLGVAGALGFTPVGIAAGTAAVGIGLLTSALQNNSQQAQETEQRIRSLREELLRFDDPGSADALSAALEKALKDLDIDAKEALSEAGLTVDAIVEALANPDDILKATELLDSAFDEYNGKFKFRTEELDQLVEFLQARGLDITLEDIAQTFQTGTRKGFRPDEAILKPLKDTLAEVKTAAAEAQIEVGFVSPDVTGTAVLNSINDYVGGLIEAGEEQQALAEAAGIVEEALTAAFNVEKGKLQDNVNDAKNALDEARTAADQALNAILQFFRGEELDATEALDKAVLAAPRLAQSFKDAIDAGFTGLTGNIEESSQVGISLFNEAARQVANDVGGILKDGLGTSILTEQDAQSALGPYILGLLEQGDNAARDIASQFTDNISAGDFDFNALIQGLVDAGDTGTALALQTIQDKVVGAFDEEEIQANLEILAELAENTVPDLERELAEAEITLSNFVLDPAALSAAAAGIVNTLGTDLESPANKQRLAVLGNNFVSGIAEGIADSPEVGQSSAAIIQSYIDAAVQALDSNSPSRRTANEIGKPFAQGIAKGIDDESPTAVSSARNIGRNLVNGTIAGIDGRQGVLYNRIRQLINGAVLAAQSAARISSPSREFRDRVGDPIVQGIILGIIDNEFDLYDNLDRLIVNLIRQLDDTRLKFRSTGNTIADAIGQGFEDSGSQILGSVSGLIESAYLDSLTKAQLFRGVGQEIALSLFQGTASRPNLTGGRLGGTQEGFGPLLALFDASEGITKFTESLQSIREEFNGSRISFDFLRAGGRDAIRAFAEAGNGIRDYAATLIQSGRPLSNVISDTRLLRDQLIGQARAAGATSAQIRDMIQRLGLADNQLANFVKQVEATQKAAEQAAKEAERLRKEEQKQRDAEEKARRAYQERERREREEERRREQEARDQERREREAEERRRRETTLPPAAFENLIIQTPAGDPEAVALLIANRVAYSIRGT